MSLYAPVESLSVAHTSRPATSLFLVDCTRRSSLLFCLFSLPFFPCSSLSSCLGGTPEEKNERKKKRNAACPTQRQPPFLLLLLRRLASQPNLFLPVARFLSAFPETSVTDCMRPKHMRSWFLYGPFCITTEMSLLTLFFFALRADPRSLQANKNEPRLI